MTLLALAVGCAVQAEEPVPWAETTEPHAVTTADGVAVNLHHRAGDGPPVLIVHGISSNHRCWDFSEDRSLAQSLVDAGYDAWMLDLRGHGDHRQDPVQGRSAPGKHWTLDDYATLDVPAALAYIQDQTGAERVGYVGHSLGGMVGALYGALHTDAANATLSAFIPVGSPVDFSDPDPLMFWALSAARRPVIPVIDTQRGAVLKAQVGTHTAPSLWLDAMLFNDLSPELRPELYRQVVSPMTRGELEHLGVIGHTGALTNATGELDALAALGAFTVPTLVITGRADHIASADRALPLYDAVGTDDRGRVVASRAAGFSADYGHMDLTMGDHAAQEIYPLIVDWLETHTP